VFIYSKLSEKGLLDASGVNIIGDLLGLIGVYIKNELYKQNYDENSAYSILKDNYVKQYLNDGKKHGIRNIGECDIKNLLIRDEYNIPRKSFRFFSQTWNMVPVVSFLDTDLIFNKIIERVHNEPILWKVACDTIFKFNDKDDCIREILDFQYVNVSMYLIGGESSKKRSFRIMFENWRNNLVVKYLRK